MIQKMLTLKLHSTHNEEVVKGEVLSGAWPLIFFVVGEDMKVIHRFLPGPLPE
jgi:hypothetical protein